MSYFKKTKTPYEIKNAREWDPNKTSQAASSSEEDEDDHDPEDDAENSTVSSNHQYLQLLAAQMSLDDVDDGFKPVIRRFTKQASSTSNGKPKLAQNGDAAAAFSQTTSTRQASQAKAKILRNENGQPIDPIIQYDPIEIKRVQQLKLCKWHFLLTKCLNNQCAYNHHYKPNEHELQTLMYISRMAPCKLGTTCTNPKCIYGHWSPDETVGQNGTNLHSGSTKAPVTTHNGKTRAGQHSNFAVTTVNSKAPEIINRQLSVSDTTSEGDMLPSEIPSAAQHRRPRSFFRFDRDNSARAAFRQRQAHAGSFQLHKGVIEIEPDPTRLASILAEFGVRLGSFVRPPQSAQDRELLIWGNSREVSNTLEELRNWILQSEGPTIRKPLAKELFAREFSTTNIKYKDIQKEILRKAEIARFQQIPNPDQSFEYKGAYLWPVEDVKPQDIFGLGLEAFDQTRFDLKSHIVFDNKLQMFRIYTDKDGSVDKALKMIEGTLKEYHARNARNGRTTFIHLVDPPERKTNGKDVRLQTWSSSATPSRVEYRIPVLTGDILNPMARMKWEEQSKDMTTSNTIKVQEALRIAPYECSTLWWTSPHENACRNIRIRKFQIATREAFFYPIRRFHAQSGAAWYPRHNDQRVSGLYQPVRDLANVHSLPTQRRGIRDSVQDILLKRHF